MILSIRSNGWPQVQAWIIITIFSPVHIAHGHRLAHQCLFFVEPGDSYLKLFGHDWLRVFQANGHHAFFNKRGKPVTIPDKLVVGERLIVPAGTNLTDFAIARLNRYEHIKKSAYEAMERAESFIDQEVQNRSSLHQQGLDLLAEAKAAEKELTYGFANYIEAKKLTEEALRCFKIAKEVRQIDQKGDLSK